MFRSTALRITFAYLAAFALTTAALGAIVYRIARHALEQQLDDRIAAEVSSLISEYHGEGEAGLRAVIRAREVARATNDLGYSLFDNSGRRIAGSLHVARPKPGWQAVFFQDTNERRYETARALASDIGSGRLLVVAADRDPLNDAEDLILLTLASTLVIMVAIGTVGAFVLGSFLRSRLSVIASSAEAIIQGDLSQRIPVGLTHDEFDRVGMILNTMLDRIGVLLENLQQVSSDIAHDLRQPLTRLRANLETCLEENAPKSAIERAIEQADEVLSLFSSILCLSEIEGGSLRQGFQPVDLSQLAREVAESYAPAIEDGGRSFVSEISPGAWVEGNRDLLAQALINLLDNAQAHTPKGTKIGLKVALVGRRVVVIVEDDGPGVPEADRSRILQRFTRLEASRHVAGHGLGLSLVAAIARIHGADLLVGDQSPGLNIVLTMPGDL